MCIPIRAPIPGTRAACRRTGRDVRSRPCLPPSGCSPRSCWGRSRWPAATSRRTRGGPATRARRGRARAGAAAGLRAAGAQRPAAQRRPCPARRALSIPALGLRDLAVVPYRGLHRRRPRHGDPGRRRGRQPARAAGRRRPGRHRQLPGHRPPHLVDASLRVPAVPAGGGAGRRRGRPVGATSTRSSRPGVRPSAPSARWPSSGPRSRAIPAGPRPRAMITLSTCATREDHASATSGPTSSTTPSTASTRSACWSDPGRSDASASADFQYVPDWP